TKLIRGLISETPAGFRSRRGLNYDDSAPVTPHNAPFPTYKRLGAELQPLWKLVGDFLKNFFVWYLSTAQIADSYLIVGPMTGCPPLDGGGEERLGRRMSAMGQTRQGLRVRKSSALPPKAHLRPVRFNEFP